MPAAAAAPRRQLVSVEPVIFAYTVSLAVHLTASQQLLFAKYCDSYYGADDAATVCSNATVTDANYGLQDSVSHTRLYCTIATVLPSILTCTYLGSWSDSRSRKFPLLVPLLGAALAYGLWAAQSYYASWDPRYTVLSSFVLGATGYYTASLQSCYSYLTSTLNAEERTPRIAVVEGILALALVVGSFAVGPLVAALGLSGTYAALAAANLLGVGYCLVWINDVRPREECPAAAGAGGLLSLRPIRDYVRCVLKRREGRSRAYMHAALAAFFLCFCSIDGASDVLYLFLTKSHGFSTPAYGYYVGADFGFKLCIGALFLLGARRFFGMDDLAVAMCGCMSAVLAYGLVAAAVDWRMIWIAVPLNSLQLLYGVGIRSFVSKTVADDEQGKIFAFMSSGQSAFSFLAALLFNDLYPETLGIYAGLCFLISSTLSLVAFCVLAFLKCHTRRRGAYEELPNSRSPDSDPQRDGDDDDVPHI